VIFEDGEIRVSPKLVYWIENPSTIDESVRIELLKQDVLIVTFDGDFQKLPELIKISDKYTCFLFNMDKIFSRNRVGQENRPNFIQNFSQLVQRLGCERCLVHTTSSDPVLQSMFASAGITFKETHFLDKSRVINDILTMTHSMLTISSTINRTCLRIDLTSVLYNVELTLLEGSGLTYRGHCKDISLNGLAVQIEGCKSIDELTLKSIVSVRLALPAKTVNIKKAFVTRITDNSCEIGINYDIRNEGVIPVDDANMVTRIIHNWIQGIIKTHGHMTIHEG
jgi:hypothetical protein